MSIDDMHIFNAGFEMHKVKHNLTKYSFIFGT